MSGQEESRSAPAAAPAAGWSSATERGSRLGLQILVWFFRRFGDAPARLLLVPVAIYYSLFARDGRIASREYLIRLERTRGRAGKPPGLRETFRHFHSFANVILDRVAFWTGTHEDFDIVIHGAEAWEQHIARGKGLFVVGAHIGSFDALRVIARDSGIPVNVLMFSINAPRINTTIETLDPNSNVRVIDLDPTSVRAAFEIRKCVARGEIVAVLGDRSSPGGRNRTVHSPFLGDSAAFSLGPFLLPMVLGLPVVLIIALKTGPRSYEVFIEHLADAEAVPRKQRSELLQTRIDHYASRLEYYCLKAPYQWFNFYDFWAESENGQH